MHPSFLTAMHDRSAILLFVKQPEHGKVKSRIAAVLGEDTAVALYRAFVSDILDTIDRAECPCLICVDPPGSLPDASAWLGEQRRYAPQQGEDLGERMKQAFHAIFAEGIERAVLIGSDIPDLPAELLREALQTLDRHDIVIGPALDGGYYLIGFRRESFLPEVFQGIDWGGNDVFARTMQMLSTQQVQVARLRAWCDIDTVDDLYRFLERGQRDGFGNSRTARCIETVRDKVMRAEGTHHEI